MVEWWQLVAAGLALVLLGFVVMFLGLMAGVIGGAVKQGKVEGGGVILIGPIPIIFGTSGRMAVLAGIIALALIVLALALMFYAGRLLRPLG